jgi:hypothetical protein
LGGKDKKVRFQEVKKELKIKKGETESEDYSFVKLVDNGLGRLIKPEGVSS